MCNCDSSCGCTTLCNVVEDLLLSTDQGLRCRASLDSVRSRNAYAQSQRSKGVLLHSAKRTLYSGSKHPVCAKSFEVGFSMQFCRVSVLCFLLSFMLAGVVVLKLCLSVTMLYLGYLALVELNTSGDYLAPG